MDEFSDHQHPPPLADKIKDACFPSLQYHAR